MFALTNVVAAQKKSAPFWHSMNQKTLQFHVEMKNYVLKADNFILWSDLFSFLKVTFHMDITERGTGISYFPSPPFFLLKYKQGVGVANGLSGNVRGLEC